MYGCQPRENYRPGPAKQAWGIGCKVNVGFLKNLTIIGKIPTPGDYAPDVWKLQATNGTRY